MARPSLLNLETAVWVGRLGSFSAVARKMNATQPAVSLRIRELESSLGAKLFERHGHRMEPTIRGRAFLQSIEPLLHLLQDSMALFETAAQDTGVVRIGSGDIPMTWTGDVIRSLHKALPRVTCELHIGIAGRLLTLLQDGKLDVVIVAGRIEHPALQSWPLGRTAMRWIMAADRWARYGDGQPEPASMQDLLNRGPIWLIPRTSRYFAHQAAELREHGADLRNVSTCDNMSTLIQLVAGGGIGYLPEVLIAQHLEQGRLVPLFPERAAGHVEYVLVTQRGEQNPIVRKLIELAGQHAAFV